MSTSFNPDNGELKLRCGVHLKRMIKHRADEMNMAINSYLALLVRLDNEASILLRYSSGEIDRAITGEVDENWDDSSEVQLPIPNL